MNAQLPTHDHVDAQCPACRLHALVPMALQRKDDGGWTQVVVADASSDEVVQIDACPVCNGAWFDAGELDVLAGELTGPEPGSGIETALDAASRDSKRKCPRGCGLLREHDLPGHIRTPVDHCPTCHGIWLDGHERHKLAKSTTREGQEDKKQQLARRGAIWAAQLLVQLPVEVENPARNTPWVVFTLLAALLTTFALQLFGVIGTEDCLPGRGGMPIGERCMAPVAGALRHQWRELGAGALTHGTWYTLGTHSLLHGGWAHLLGNCYFLYIFGDNVEHLFGRLKFALFFVAAAMIGGFAEVMLTKNTMAPIIGASGGIAGVMAAYLWCFPRNKLFQVILFVQIKLPVWVYLIAWFALQGVMGMFSTNNTGVAWFSHLFGFAFGAAITPLILHLRRRDVGRQVRVPATGFGGGAAAT